MKRSKRIKPLVQLARQAEQDKAVQLANLNQTLRLEEKRLHDLINYHDEYRQQVHLMSQQGVSSENWQHMYAFINGLQQLIEQQQQTIQGKKDLLAYKKQDWHQAYYRTQALLKTQDNYKKQEIKKEEKQEQSETDERNQIIKPLFRDH